METMRNRITNMAKDEEPAVFRKLPSDDSVIPLAWYPVAWSKELRDRPLKCRIAGIDMVLYRTSKQKARALEAYCAHRGADLSLGKCIGDHLHCAYHGWEFSENGICEKIPAHPDRPIPDFARVKAYPVEECAGLIWVWPDANIPTQPLRVFPEILEAQMRLAAYEQTWNAHLTRVVESVLDVAHLAFVHQKTIGRHLRPEIPKIQFSVEQQDVIQIQNGGGHLRYEFPQQWILTPSSEARRKFINYVVFSPMDGKTTKIFGYAGRNFMQSVPGMDRIFSRYSLKILNEDREVVESQHPRPIPEALRMEAHVPADAPQIRFRQRWFEFLSSDEAKLNVQS